MMVLSYKSLPTDNPKIFIMDYVWRGKVYIAQTNISGKAELDALMIVLGALSVHGIYFSCGHEPDVILKAIGFEIYAADALFPKTI